MTKIRITMYDRPDEETRILGPDDIVESKDVELGNTDDPSGQLYLHECIDSLVSASFGEFAEIRLERLDDR